MPILRPGVNWNPGYGPGAGGATPDLLKRMLGAFGAQQQAGGAAVDAQIRDINRGYQESLARQRSIVSDYMKQVPLAAERGIAGARQQLVGQGLTGATVAAGEMSQAGADAAAREAARLGPLALAPEQAEMQRLRFMQGIQHQGPDPNLLMQMASGLGGAFGGGGTGGVIWRSKKGGAPTYTLGQSRGQVQAAQQANRPLTPKQLYG